MPTFWDILSHVDKVKLIKLQWEWYGTKLDMMAGGKPADVRPTGYYDLNLEQIDREMRKPPEHQRRVV